MSLYEPLQNARRIIIKLGTQVVIDREAGPAGGLARDRMEALVRQCAMLAGQGRELILVSSGAVGLGRQALDLQGPLSLNEKQACAAVGQSLLMDVYREMFSQSGRLTAQVLLTAADFSNRRHYLNLRQTLETLLKLNVIPIINENDTTSTMEIQEGCHTKGFGDNDMLSALVAGKLDADVLVILTNVDGIYSDNPETNPQARRLRQIESFQDMQRIEASGQSAMGRGGMASKLQAARLAAMSGAYTWIASGLRQDALTPLLNGAGGLLKEEKDFPGTLIFPHVALLSGKKRWIGASGYHGAVVVNEGAREALVEKQASLLPIGITAVRGDFSAQQVISIQDEQGMEVGRGLTYFSSAEIEKIRGVRSENIADRLELPGRPEHPEVIHRDNLIIFEEYGGG